jgi:hypothetical protein
MHIYILSQEFIASLSKKDHAWFLFLSSYLVLIWYGIDRRGHIKKLPSNKTDAF